MGAVNKPDALTVPDVAAHATVVFEVLITVAVNCWVFPETTVAVEGEAEMLTALALDDTLAPPQAARISRPENNREARKKNQPGVFSGAASNPFQAVGKREDQPGK